MQIGAINEATLSHTTGLSSIMERKRDRGTQESKKEFTAVGIIIDESDMARERDIFGRRKGKGKEGEKLA